MENLLTYTKEYSEIIEQLIDLLEEKIECLKKDDVATLENIMKQEQALSLKLRGVDNKREKWQKENGFEKLTLKEIIDSTKGDMQKPLLENFTKLSLNLNEFNNLNALSKSIIETKIYTLEKNVTYSAKGEIDNKNKSSLHKNV